MAFGVLASVGKTQCRRILPRVGVMLRDINRNQLKPKPGQIHNTNGPCSPLWRFAAAASRYLGIARDDRAITRSLVEGLSQSDVVLIAGGVSVGDFDLVPEVLKELGVTFTSGNSHQTRQAAGIGTGPKGQLVFGCRATR